MIFILGLGGVLKQVSLSFTFFSNHAHERHELEERVKPVSLAKPDLVIFDFGVQSLLISAIFKQV